MDDLNSMKKNAGIFESPIRKLSHEAHEQLARDMETVAAQAILVANALHERNEKEFDKSWKDFNYYTRRTISQMNQN